MIPHSYSPEILHTVPRTIDKTKHHFVPRVLRVNGKPPKRFGDLIIGDTFKVLTTKVKAHERELLMRKVKASAHENNAVVICTFSPHTNPCGQMWTVDATCPVQKDTQP